MERRPNIHVAPQCKYGCPGVCFLFVIYVLLTSGTPQLQDDLIVREVGLRGATSHRLYFWFEGRKISPWHDLPLRPPEDASMFTFVCEIPKGETAKMEINKEAVWNPIIQDVKKGKLRHYHTPSLVNYGAFPQTWEDPTEVDPLSGFKGDNDPLDVLELGSVVGEVGEVYAVRVLGVLGMIDGGEVDWKVLTVRATETDEDYSTDAMDDPQSPLRRRIADIVQWFRVYKVPDGKPENEFTNEGQPYSRRKALQVIIDAHKRWKALYDRQVPNPDEFWLGGGAGALK